MARTKRNDVPAEKSYTKKQVFLKLAKIALLVVVCAFLWMSCFTFDYGDWPNPNSYPHNDPLVNWCGPAGAWLSYQFFHFLGQGSWVILFFSTVVSLMYVSGQLNHGTWLRISGMVILVCVSSSILSLVHAPGKAGLPEGSGGVVGLSAVEFLKQYFSGFGSSLILLLGLAIGLILAADELVVYLPAFFRRAWAGLRVLVVTFAQPRLPVKPSAGPKKVKALAVPKNTAMEEDETADAAQDVEISEAEDEVSAEADVSFPLEKVEPKIFVARALTQTPPRKDKPSVPKELGDWGLPPIDLLSNERNEFPPDHEEQIREKARILERTLKEFRIEAVVVEIDTGPVVTMFELQIGPGIKVQSIIDRSKDMARTLKAPAVRVVAPIPGKNTIGIEVPNTEKQPVRLRELMDLAGNVPDRMEIPVFLGKDASGNPLVCDLTRMPHSLIAGTTGSGKSVCINSIILSILLTQRPDNVKMIMVDPKMVEMSIFKEVPHLMCPVITDVDKAQAILEWLVQKMEERYAILSEAQVRNIQDYNKLGREVLLDRMSPTDEEEANRICTRLPYIVLIIDELADLMMVSPKEVELCLARLAQKSRAVGIHMILATQRPEAKVVTGLIKSNLPSRIAFRVNSRLDSRIVLDQNGAEDLLGQGDMLFLPPGKGKPDRAQGTLVDDGELRRVLKFLAEKAQPQFNEELMQIGKVDLAAGERDEMFDDAVRIVLASRRGSVSLLQRKLAIGYSRASRLIEQMGVAGIVGDYKGSQAREVMMTLEEYEDLRSSMNQEVSDGMTD
ncbi:MAG: DNA translocase FtsK [Phycisphaerae bacterium]|nr:DNA translocase FtsK [Phycisphaerae bacterium]